jgi:single-stranded-DNA-specific exonuclease
MIKTVTGYLLKQKEYSESLCLAIKRQFGFSDLLSRLISIRYCSLITKEDLNRNQNADKLSHNQEDVIDNLSLLESYIKPKIQNNIIDPFLLKDIDKATTRTLQAIINKERICIFGDYDVDGSCSSAIIYRFLANYNLEPEIYIPDRIKEGYGPNNNAIEQIAKRNSLVIMLDCGTCSIEQISFAKKLGLDVIIIDHHKPGPILPECIAIVNPNRLDQPYIRSDIYGLCAAGVSFLFLVALSTKIKLQNMPLKNELTDLIPFVSIATVCDVMPLVGLNRAFVARGLTILNQESNPTHYAIKRLLLCNGNSNKITTYHFGFVIGPMINAGGRIGQSDLGAILLSNTKNIDLINSISQTLHTLNKERVEIESKILADVKNINNITNKVHEKGFFFEYGNWHEGVIGIIASRAKDMFLRPAIVGSICENNIIKCSARSIGKIDIGSIILKAVTKNILTKGGGHKGAAGFCLKLEKYAEFVNFLHNEIKELSDIEYNGRTVFYDIAITVSSININICKEIEKLEPFGVGNQKVTFLIKSVKIIMTKVIKDKHISILISDAHNSTKSFWAISFNSFNTKLGDSLVFSKGKELNLVANIEIDFFNGEEKLKIYITDCFI